MTLTYQSFRMTLSPDDNALSYQVRSQKVKWFKRYRPDTRTEGHTETVIPIYLQPLNFVTEVGGGGGGRGGKGK